MMIVSVGVYSQLILENSSGFDKNPGNEGEHVCFRSPFYEWCLLHSDGINLTIVFASGGIHRKP